MPELTPQKQMNVIRLYFQGESYQTIAQKSGVAKGSVVNVITMLKSGQFPDFRDTGDQVHALREVVVQLKRSGLSLPQAAVGLSAFQGIAALGVSRGDIGRLLALCRSLTPDGVGTGKFVRAALAILEAQEHTGMGAEELEEWVNELQHRADSLVAQRQELEPMAEELEILSRQRKRLIEEHSSRISEMGLEKQELEDSLSCLKEKLETVATQVQVSQRLISELGRRQSPPTTRSRS